MKIEELREVVTQTTVFSEIHPWPGNNLLTLLNVSKIFVLPILERDEDLVERIAQAIHSKDEGRHAHNWYSLADWRKGQYREWAEAVLSALTYIIQDIEIMDSS